MDTIGNPFGAPPPPRANTNAVGNPFGETPTQHDSPWGVSTQQQIGSGPSVGNSSAYSTQSNPFGAPPAQPSSYGIPPHMQYQNSYQGQPQNQIGYPSTTPQSNNPFGAPQTHNNAVVLATIQSNPYALAPQAQYGLANQQQIVPVNQQLQPWAMTQQNQQLVPSIGGYDPFAQQQHLAPAPVPPSHDIDLFLQPQQQAIEPYQQTPQQQPEMEPYVVKNEEPHPVAANGHVREPHPPHEKEEKRIEIKEAPDVAASPEGTMYPPQIQYGHRPDIKPDREPTDTSPRNPYAPLLAQEAPPGASPLPKAELVRKRGFALSRISFRTIVMKKWKQTYWVQYGPHTMLWFRSQADFDDWLNNPYHMQTERNFLIKLAVNFVHDLYKPNVRGYQVTQCRTKGYGNKIVRQFKLERWMDYGPTIAAAFGSYDPAEVDTLREAIVECMRNTPLEGGIRATGAVRQPNPNSTMSQRRDREEEDDDDDEEGKTSTHIECSNLINEFKFSDPFFNFRQWKALFRQQYDK
jgi:ribosomal protein S14